MVGIIFATLSALSKGFEKVLHRFILIREDSLSYAFVWHILTAVVFLPLFIIEFSLPKQSFAWLLVIISSALWSIIAYVGFKAYSYLEVSIKTPIGKSRMLFVLLLSVIFLKETLTPKKILGTFLIFTGIVILTYKRGKRFGSLKERGVQLTLLSAFLTSVVWLVDKYSTNFFNPGMYSFLVYFVPSIMLLPFTLRKKQELKSLLKFRSGAVIFTVILGAAHYYLILRAFKLTEASIVVPIVELSTLIAVFSGIKFLKESKEVPKKIIAAMIVILGAVLIAGVT